jgi:hypothetical protein
VGHGTWKKLRQDHSAHCYGLRKLTVLTRINMIEAGGNNRDSYGTRIETTAMRFGVYSQGKPADNTETSFRQLTAKPSGRPRPIYRGTSTPDHSYRGPHQITGVTDAKQNRGSIVAIG